MNTLAHELFSPLGRDYCVYFYYLTIISFVLFVVSVIGGAHGIMTGKLGVGLVLGGLVSPFLLYFTNRLLYGMCVH
jgi:hypothetical protein